MCLRSNFLEVSEKKIARNLALALEIKRDRKAFAKHLK